MISFIRAIFKYKDFVVLFFALIISLTLILSNDNSSIFHLKSRVNSFVSTIFNPFIWYDNIFSLKEDNAILKQKIAQLNLENKKLHFYSDENIKLKKMLDYKVKSIFDLIVANVKNHSLTPNLNSFYIDIDSNVKIEKNLPVIDMHGIVGKTIRIDEDEAIVQLLTDKNFRISVRIGQNRNLGVFVPRYSKIGTIEGIPKSQKILVDEVVFTSGISDIYPPNIPVAKVVSTNVDPNELFQNITVRILADIFNPDYVFIVQ